MLNILLWSFLGALVCTILTMVLPIIKDRKGLDIRLKFSILTFAIDFFYMVIFLYVSCNSQTYLTVIMYMFPALVVNAVIMYATGNQIEGNFNIILAVISFVLCFIQFAFPVQKLVYVHDMENVDVTYTISSEELIARTELKIGNNNGTWKNKYSACEPEMRKVNGRNIAVYEIKESYGEIGSTEYIPGYAIQEKDGSIKIISKRIYFSISYENSKDALRTVRRKYPTVIIGDHKFDIDDNWNPYEVFMYRESFFSSDGKDYGLIILNLMNGTSKKYPMDKVPSWVDFKSTYPR